MAVEVYLGNPPANIRTWIEQHSQPAGHSETIVTYTASSGHADWSGQIAGTLTDQSIPNMSDVETVDIGTSVTSIGEYAFRESNIKNVIIPDSVTSIGEGAFYACNNLMSITLPSNITHINAWTFCYCFNMLSVTIPDSVTNILNSALYYCQGLSSLTIPSSVSSIGTDALGACTSLTSVMFENRNLIDVQEMSNYPWGIEDTSIITASW